MIEVKAPDRARDDEWAAPSSRPIRRRRSLPGTRAVVGALLVCLAAVGLYVAATSASARGRVHVAVATRDMAPGDRIGPGDVELQLVELPGPTRHRVFASTALLEGDLVIGPVGKGEVIQQATVLSKDRTPPFREVTLQIDAAQAKAVASGDAVDVLLTTGTGDTTRTAVVAAGIRVLRIGSSGQGFGTDPKPPITFAVASIDEVNQLVQAVHIGSITLVRSNGFRDQVSTAPTGAAATRVIAP
jgi:Flp pilus assembly protein CpaB